MNSWRITIQKIFKFYKKNEKINNCFFWNQTLVFFSLDRFVTKNQILNTMSVFYWVGCPLPFSNFELCHLVFIIWFLVTTCSNWKNKSPQFSSGLHIIFFINWSLLEWKSKFWFKCQNNFFQASNFHYKTAKSK